MKRSGLKLSPCGVPTFTLLLNGFDLEVPFILVSMTVPLKENYTNLSSSSSTIDYTRSRRWRLSMVSKTTDISMLMILIVFIFLVLLLLAIYVSI